ncbi:MAG TPA: hypothetical protein VNE82_07470 [Candidatus Binataceae bacterium]|nr:hypothetical protein [Candidatus Binataceae bacterium]
MSGWMGGRMWNWTVMGVLVVVVLDVENTLFANDRFAADLGGRQRRAFDAAERERFLAVIRVLARTERGLDAAAYAGSAKQEARWKSFSHSPRRTTTRFCSISMGC